MNTDQAILKIIRLLTDKTDDGKIFWRTDRVHYTTEINGKKITVGDGYLDLGIEGLGPVPNTVSVQELFRTVVENTKQRTFQVSEALRFLEEL